MTIEEAKEIIKQDIYCEYDMDLIEALNMAIASLEAWDAVKQEITYAAKHTNGYYEGQSNTYWIDLDKVMQIIGKHLQEVTHE